MSGAANGLSFEARPSYVPIMDTPRDPTRPTLPELIRELDQSQSDLAAGRMAPVAPVLSAIRARASRRIELRRQAERAEAQGQADPG